MFRPSPHLGQSGMGGRMGVINISCVRVTQFFYRKPERIRASAERDRRSQWDHAVAEESESLRTVLQCSGHPISHSTNSGFKRRCEFGALGKDGGPNVGVSGSRWKRCASMSSGSPNPFPFLPFAFSRALRAVQLSTDSSCCSTLGVGHCGACLPRSAFTGTVCDEVPSL